MVSTLELWLPILLSAVAVFIVSSLIHMVLKFHWNDFSAVPSEDEFMDAMRPLGLSPGEYVFPKASDPKQMEEAGFKEKLAKGPVGLLTVMSSEMEMGKSLFLWFLYCILMGMFAAYLSGRALGPGADYLAVFRFVGASAFGGYALALLQNSIWFKRGWVSTMKHVLDGFIYACLTAGIFAWLWPA